MGTDSTAGIRGDGWQRRQRWEDPGAPGRLIQLHPPNGIEDIESKRLGGRLQLGKFVRVKRVQLRVVLEVVQQVFQRSSLRLDPS